MLRAISGRLNWLQPLLALTILAMLGACNLGTDVGNGVKPNAPKSEKDETKDTPVESSEERASNKSNEEPNVATDSAGGIDKDTADNPREETSMADYTRFFLAECGSPLSQALGRYRDNTGSHSFEVTQTTPEQPRLFRTLDRRQEVRYQFRRNQDNPSRITVIDYESTEVCVVVREISPQDVEAVYQSGYSMIWSRNEDQNVFRIQLKAPRGAGWTFYRDF